MLDDKSRDDSSSQIKRARRLRRWEWWESLGSPKHVAAPMVDQSELAFRMLVRTYGVHLAYTPMLNSKVFSISKTYRYENFDTAEGDSPLIAQFAGDDHRLLIESAKYIQDQVSAVDINFGCPQGIAKKGHYGSYLLAEPHLCTSLVGSMVQNLDCPVTAKMRIVNLRDPGFQDTVNLVSQFESAGVDMVCLHTRTREMNKELTGAPIWEACKVIKDRFKSFPIVCNGGVENYNDVVKCMDYTGCDAVMSSEGLLERPDLFSGPTWSKTSIELAKEYIFMVRKYPLRHKFETRCVRSHMFRLLYSNLQSNVDLRDKMGAARTVDEIEKVVDELAVRETIIGTPSWYRRHREKNVVLGTPIETP
jgi:tRNA-dihydrouridine synthase